MQVGQTKPNTARVTPCIYFVNSDTPLTPLGSKYFSCQSLSHLLYYFAYNEVGRFRLPHLPPKGEGVDTVSQQPAGGAGFLRADTFLVKVSLFIC